MTINKLFVPLAVAVVAMTVSAYAGDCSKCTDKAKTTAKAACCDKSKSATADGHKHATTTKKGMDLSEKGGKALTSP